MAIEDPYGMDARRQRLWSRRLGRLRLGAEPLEMQLERLRRVTWALTIVSAVVASILFGLFAAFRAPIYGVIVAGGLIVPVVSLAWLDFVRLARTVRDYQSERREHDIL
jgi:hypothetical protein